MTKHGSICYRCYREFRALPILQFEPANLTFVSELECRVRCEYPVGINGVRACCCIDLELSASCSLKEEVKRLRTGLEFGQLEGIAASMHGTKATDI